MSLMERARETLLRAGLVRLASAEPEAKLSRREILEGSERDEMVAGSIGWQYDALSTLRRLGLITSTRSTRGYQRTAGAASSERLLAISKEVDLQWLWYRGATALEDGEDDIETIEGENPPVATASTDWPSEDSSAPSYTLEEKVDMLLLLLPKVAERLGDVAEALRTYGVTPDLRDAVLDSHRILKELET